MMKHKILFDGCDNHWDNALPFGNGVFGCMLFYENDRLHMPMNHYDVYYNISSEVLPEDIYTSGKDSDTPGEQWQKLREQADNNRRNKSIGDSKIKAQKIGDFPSYPCTGELIFTFEDSIKGAEQKLSLYIEDARGELLLDKEKDHVSVDTIVARRDCILNHVKQSTSGLVSEVQIAFPHYRSEEPITIVYEQQDDHTVSYTVTRMLSGVKPFVFSGVLRFIDAKIVLKEFDDRSAVLAITESEKEFHVITGIFTDWKYSEFPKDAVEGIDKYAGELDELIREHQRYWKSFFEQSSISLPDAFLEKVYVLNQYALDCCSGKDGIMKHHACGLNGLWAIRHPNIWGSKWYWDVNIQSAFAGVFSSNRLDLAKVFSDGLLSYTKLAERFAHDVHNLKGCASDYPHALYYSCFSWCAQYLWFLYEYSLDEEYLRKEAYPLFLKLCEFMVGVFEYDASRDEYVVYPDYSPEQGPLTTHNSVITVACTKYLFRFTLKAAEILGDSSSILNDCRRILEKMPAYPHSSSSKYGVHLIDSEDALNNLWIRHPSMIMPVFPIGELDASSDPETVQMLSNTLDYLEENCELGVFQGGWIAAAGARMGRGQFAYRILYERGIDHLLRSNGMTAESTERFYNFCLAAKPPLYYPCMVEYTGGMVAAVNEMLLQSHNHVIRVFPAIPDGDLEPGRLFRNGYQVAEYNDRYRKYDAWENVKFDKLLAKGAFEISAELKDRKLSYILVHSLKGGSIDLTSPFIGTMSGAVYCDGIAVPYEMNGDVYHFDTEAGKTYLVAECAELDMELPQEKDGYDEGVQKYLNYIKRHVYIGEDKDTHYQKQLDSFMRGWIHSNVQQANRTVYKFDFTDCKDKDYDLTIPRQAYIVERGLAISYGFIPVGAEEFKPVRGYGFSDAADIRAAERGGEDPLRYDLLEGQKEVEFIIEATRGQYEMLVISGDTEEESVTIAQIENSRVIGGKVVKKGYFQSEVIPFVQEQDGLIRLRIATTPGYKWKLNALILNMVRGY